MMSSSPWMDPVTSYEHWVTRKNGESSVTVAKGGLITTVQGVDTVAEALAVLRQKGA
ncbi:hypothetical protein ABZW11_17280 [Nonomuraea sp. NPDC004580]|uniref:hypothetical protein n=1 Tax=Nonomuraea sp. NPDC004580 TaxID=3154552 RepID=UPI0033A497CF